MVHLDLGVALKGKGQLDEAIACYQKAIALDPKDAKPHNNLGLALYDKGQLDADIACYKKAVELDPQNYAYLDSLGIAHKTVTHPAVFTVEEARELRGAVAGGHTKNLFLRDKKGAANLVVAP